MRIFLVLLFSFPLLAHGEDIKYPWRLTGFAGNAMLCTEQGCFDGSGFAFGASFGRQFTGRWSFELDGTFARTEENLAPRFDLNTDTLYIPQLQRSRFWGGGTFLGSFAHFGKRSDAFVSIGFIAAVERRSEKTPPGIRPLPSEDIGIKGGVSGGAGLNLWFSKNWAIRPEAKFNAVAGNLSGFRYSAGILRQF
jgi:hypothetical protein